MPEPDDATGLSLHDLRLVRWDARWPVIAEQACTQLRALHVFLDLAHIGSTAIPGLSAKPVIDLAATVHDDPADPGLRARLAELGYAAHGEYGLPGRQFFTLGDPPRLHLHVVASGSEHWHDWLTFRDFLRAHPDWVQRYEAEKQRLILDTGGDRTAYTKAKGVFIREALSAAGAPDA
ncbi:MAG TPA: GrpB family protein [Kiritimatiellia bacterium]|nr:GrpB family protein [Kiritimatiellia bacterium]HMO97844.1 GrpB family protein [Kiritimatiellia bacterium]HMP97598.1 GrpB family protein [Kiritimatiellia bacterium]